MDRVLEDLLTCELLKNIPTMDLNANVHLTLKSLTFKVKVSDKGCIHSAHVGLHICDV